MKNKNPKNMSALELENYMSELEDLMLDKQDEEHKETYVKAIAKNKLYEVKMTFGIPILARNEKEAKNLAQQDFSLNHKYESLYSDEAKSYEYEPEVTLLDLEDEDFHNLELSHDCEEIYDCFDEDNPIVGDLIKLMKKAKGSKK